MIRGTTPTLEFTLPFDTDIIADGYITFAQRGDVVIDKNISECTCEGTKIVLKLSQEETLKLKSGDFTEVQIRAKMTSGDAVASNIIKVSTDRILKEGVI